MVFEKGAQLLVTCLRFMRRLLSDENGLVNRVGL
jgi:hypothetical protein